MREIEKIAAYIDENNGDVGVEYKGSGWLRPISYELEEIENDLKMVIHCDEDNAIVLYESRFKRPTKKQLEKEMKWVLDCDLFSYWRKGTVPGGNKKVLILGSLTVIEYIEAMKIHQKLYESNNKWQYIFTGNFSADNKTYFIDITMPKKYQTAEEAKKDHCSARFELQDGHVVLVIYSDWYQSEDNDGIWHKGVRGKVLQVIRWEDYCYYKMMALKEEKEGAGYIDAIKDCIPFAMPWDELFHVDELPEGWNETVENLAYSVVQCAN